MDINTAFLNESLNETIYMEQSKGFIEMNQEEKVCKLLKFIYRLI